MEPSPAAASLLGSVSLLMVHFNGFLTIHTEKNYLLSQGFPFSLLFISTGFPTLAVPPENLGPRVRTYMCIYSSGVIISG